METPHELRTVDQRDGHVRTRRYDDGSVIVADFGADAGEISVDVVGDTAIVVAGDQQIEFELPEGADEISVNNGVLTIEE
ncbi:DUF7127 family protein [Halalkalicoccus salilacus]|jgi:HSP20 family molecular chaperone IbpA|uniref:DUF7127 family protein n=1 Tax=Halalkalicoccus TaxID=332246 RepID=UPI002F96D2DA